MTAVAVERATVQAPAGERVFHASQLVKTYRMGDVEVHGRSPENFLGGIDVAGRLQPAP